MQDVPGFIEAMITTDTSQIAAAQRVCISRFELDLDSKDPYGPESNEMSINAPFRQWLAGLCVGTNLNTAVIGRFAAGWLAETGARRSFSLIMRALTCELERVSDGRAHRAKKLRNYPGDRRVVFAERGNPKELWTALGGHGIT